MHKKSFLSYVQRRPLVLPSIALLCAALSGCASSSQTYAGDLKPTAGACDAAARATLQRHGANIQFSPHDGVITLDGTLNSAGQIVAAQQTIGMDRKPYHLSFTGHLAGDKVTGEYVTPRCRYAIELHLAE